MLANRDEGRLISIFSHDDGIILGGLLENFREVSRLTGFPHGFESEHKLEDMKTIRGLRDTLRRGIKASVVSATSNI